MSLVKFVYEQQLPGGEKRILEKELEMPYEEIPKEARITNARTFLDDEYVPISLRIGRPIEAEWKADGFQYTVRLVF